MNILPFFHLSGENSLMKSTLDESREEIFLVHADTLEVMYLNRTALERRGHEGLGLPLNIARIGTEYSLRPFKDLIQPLMSGSCSGISFLTHHRGTGDKTYPVDVRITRNTIQGLDYLLLTATDISERIHLERELKHRNEDLKKSGTELDLFVSYTATDLQDALVRLNQLIAKGQSPERHGQDSLYADLEVVAGNIKRTITEMMAYSAMIHRPLSRKPVDLHELFQDVQNKIKAIEGSERTSLKVHIDQAVPFYSDPACLEELLFQLMERAVRQSKQEPGHSYVKIRIQVPGKKAIISISDNGLGMAPEGPERNLVKQNGSPENNHQPGLGLFLVKEILRKLRGTFQLTSLPGEGTDFFLEIPNKTPRGSVHKRVNKK